MELIDLSPISKSINIYFFWLSNFPSKVAFFFYLHYFIDLFTSHSHPMIRLLHYLSFLLFIFV